MTFTGAHKEIPIADVHIPYSFEYADAATREADASLIVDDEGKFARQLDDDSIWMLTDYTGPTWIAVGSSLELATVAEAGTGTNNTKAVTPAGLFGASVDVASATPDIGAAASLFVRITGTTTITAFDNVAAGIRRIGYFAGALTLTHNGTSLILPGGANITTAAGDGFEAISLGSGNWKVVFYQKADGTAIVGGAGPTPPTQIDATDISGCVNWIDLDQESGSEGDAIGTLSDFSASNNDATQGTGANKPILRLNVANGKKGAYFDGSNDYLTYGTNIDLPTTHTILIVMAPMTKGAYSALLQYKQQGIYQSINGTPSWGIYRSGDGICDFVAGGQPQVVGLWGNSNSDYDFIHNYLRKVGTNTNSFTSASTSYLGTDALAVGVQVHAGYLFEVRIYDNKIAEADLYASIDWLLYKWRGLIRQ